MNEIIPEPIGAAHRNPEILFNSIFDSLKLNLEQIISLSRNELKSTRNKRFLDF